MLSGANTPDPAGDPRRGRNSELARTFRQTRSKTSVKLNLLHPSRLAIAVSRMYVSSSGGNRERTSSMRVKSFVFATVRLYVHVFYSVIPDEMWRGACNVVERKIHVFRKKSVRNCSGKYHMYTIIITTIILISYVFKNHHSY